MLSSGLIYFSVGIGRETVKPGARTVRFLGARTDRCEADRPRSHTHRESSGHFLGLRLEGTQSNRDGVGATKPRQFVQAF
jgi:hypothetical protein